MRTTAVLVLLVAATLVPPQRQASVEAKPPVDWLELARAAWGYFSPGFGLSQRGINYATPSWHYVTDWDVGHYLSAIVDAAWLGLISRDEAISRAEKVLAFLSTRPLHPSGVPYSAYSSDTGMPAENAGPSNPSDAGRLLIALYRLKKSFPELAPTVDYVVERNGFSAFAGSVPDSGFYSYYYAYGFHLWGFNTPQVMKALSMLGRLPYTRTVDAYGVRLPYVEVTMEPILLTIFELDPPPEFYEWAYKVYKAQENRYLATGKPTAFTEGQVNAPPYYIYEWIVDIYTGETWTVWSGSLGKLSMTPVVYAKAALGMHAIWNTNYTAFLAEYVMKAKTPNCFYEGVDENGNVVYAITDKTNAMIVSAARYALQRASKPSVTAGAVPALYPGENATITLNVTHQLPLPITLSAEAPPGITAEVEPSTGKANLTARLKVSARQGLAPGNYTVTVKVSTIAHNETLTLTVTVKPPGYTLRVRVVDACGDPVPGATLLLNGLKAGETDAKGEAEVKHVEGEATLTAIYAGLEVAGPLKISVNSDTNATLKANLRKIAVAFTTPDGKPATGILVVALLGRTTLSTAKTNSTGHALLPRIPPANITLQAYTPDGKLLLGEWTVNAAQGEGVVDPEIPPTTRHLEA
ncbi:DUF3131 domain-containing protein [Thermofilum pendens]